jgi:hypothetical protein
MDIQTGADIRAARDTETAASRIYAEGFTAGLLGAATIALWFFLLDVINGRPFYTPTVLGTALFRGAAALQSPETLPISFEMVTAFTWVHLLVFALIGGLASRLLAMVENTPNTGFGIVLLFVLFECGFVTASVLFADTALQALGVVPVLVGNLLAAVTMALYFRLRHPSLRIEP